MFRTLMIALAALSLSACHPKAQVADQGGADPAVAKNLNDSKAFLAKNAKEPGVVVLPDGLQYKIIHSGPTTGMKPHSADEVKINYEGKLINNKVFDSSYERGQPASMPLNRLIKAWQEALPMMRPGDVWILYVPPQLGYGDEGAGNGDIPGGSALIFKIELIDFLPGPGSIQQG